MFALDVSPFTKPLPECLDVARMERAGVRKQNADPDPSRRLGLGRERCGKHAQDEAAQECAAVDRFEVGITHLPRKLWQGPG